MKGKIKRDETLLLVCVFLYIGTINSTTPIVLGFVETLGATGTIMGSIGAILGLVSIIVRPALGNLVDMMSKYRLTLIGAVLLILGGVLCAFSSNYVYVIVARIISGLGYACVSVCCSTWLAYLLPKEELGKGMGLYGAMNAIALALAPYLGVKLYPIIGYKAVFLISSGFALALAITISFISNKGPATRSFREFKNSKVQIADVKIIYIAIIVMLFGVQYFSTQQFIVTYFEEKNVRVSTGLFFPIYAATVFCSRLFLKRYFLKIDFKYFVFGSGLFSASSLLLLHYANNNIELIFASICMALGYGTIISEAQSVCIDQSAEGKKGLGNATYYLGIDAGLCLGPIISGIIYEKLPINYFYPLLMITVPLIFITLGVNGILTKKRKEAKML